jgi:hypothetical protein
MLRGFVFAAPPEILDVRAALCVIRASSNSLFSTHVDPVRTSKALAAVAERRGQARLVV